MTVTLLKRLATLAALVCLAATLNTSVVGAQESRPGTEAALAGDQTPGQQINRLYGAIFQREPDAGGFAFWVNELDTGARTLQQIADAMVGISPEFADTYGNLDNRNFVNRLYLNVQGRPGEDDPTGSAFWTSELDSNNRTRGGVVLGFSESVEYRVATGSTDPVGRLYCAFFLRNPDAGGEAFYRDQYLVTERSLTNIAQEFTQSPEFTDTYGSLSDRQFVELIYKNVLGRNLPLTETEGPNFWTGQLSTGARTRGQVMVEFSESPEYGDLWTSGEPCPAAGNAVASAVNDNGTVTFEGSVDINWAQNDTLPSGTTSAITTQGTKGNAVDNNNGTFTYTSTTGDDTTDSFTYTLTSADGVTSVGTVNITILPAGADGIPTAVDDVVAATAASTTVIPWAANDITDASVTVATFTQPANGVVVLAGNTFTYTPNAGFTNNTDTFTYTLTDGGDPADTSTATVTVNVGGADTGAAVADRFIVVADTVTDLAILANDNTSGLSLSDPGTASHGTLEIVGSIIRYTPDTGYTASRTGQGLVGDSFTYTLTDASGNTSTAAVEVIVLAQPECEVFMNYPFGSANGVGGDAGNIELFFSNLGCVELYDNPATFQVAWNNVTVDGAPVTTTSPDAANVLRDLAPVSAAASADFDVTVAGTAVFSVDGATAVTVEFQLQFTSADSGASWIRVGSSFRGRGDADVTVTINPLAS